MLFLHALLFFLLGTSALAIPAPLTYAVSPLDPNRLNGLWREFGLVSEQRSFYLTQY